MATLPVLSCASPSRRKVLPFVVGMAIGLLALGTSLTSKAGTQQPVNSKPTTLTTYLRDNSTGVLLPGYMPTGFALKETRVAWVEPSPDKTTPPARRVLCLLYRNAGAKPRQIVLIQRPSLNGLSAHENLMPAVSGGYFIKNLPEGSDLRKGTKSGIDFLVVTKGLPDADLTRLTASLKKVTKLPR